MNTILIFDFKAIFKWIIVVLGYFFLGYILRGFFGYFTILLFLFFYLKKLYAYQLYLIFLWIFISPYFTGLNILRADPIVVYGSTFFLLLFIYIFIKNINEILKDKLVKNLFILNLFLLGWLIISNLVNPFNILRIPNFFGFFLIFIAILISNFNKEKYIDLLRLIAAIAIFQIPIAFAQYLKYIPAPNLSASTSTLAIKEWEADLDDAACGTFGSAGSPDLSLFLSFLGLFFVIYFIITKKNIYFILALFLLLQYTVIDSKTVLFVTVIVSFLLFIFNSRIRTGLFKSFKLKHIVLLSSFLTIFIFLTLNYYKKGFRKSDRNQLEHTSSNVKKSIYAVKNHIWEWGKIKGFKYAYQSQKEENGTLGVLFGEGIGAYKFSKQGKLWRKKTNSNFFIGGYYNNFVDTNSTLIIAMYNIGIIGLLTIILIYYSIYKHFDIRYFENEFSAALDPLIRPFIIGFLLYSFLHSAFNLNDQTVILFWSFLALSIKFTYLQKNTVDEKIKMYDK